MKRNSSKRKSQEVQVLSFSCVDLIPSCDWQVSGDNEQNIMAAVEEHSREKHNLGVLDEETKGKIRNAIRRHAAQTTAA